MNDADRRKLTLAADKGWLTMTHDEIRKEAEAVLANHDPTLQDDNGYMRCALCHYTSHPCDAYDMADQVLKLLAATLPNGTKP